MIYYIAAAVLFAALFGESSYAHAPEATWLVTLVGFIGAFLSMLIPGKFFKYDLETEASAVLTRLMKQSSVGALLVIATALLAWILIQRPDDPSVFGELYVFTAIGVFLFQGFGVAVTRHAMYLQRTRQYNSNQLVAVLLAVTLLLFTLVLYFLAFDLARPPQFHAYFRDIVAISLVLLGYGRSVYLIAHH